MIKTCKLFYILSKFEISSIDTSSTTALACSEITTKQKVQQSRLAWALWSQNSNNNRFIHFIFEYSCHQSFRHLQHISINNLERKITVDFYLFELFQSVQKRMISNFIILI